MKSVMMVHLNLYQIDTAMMKRTIQAAIMMEVTVVEILPKQITVQIVSVMQIHTLILIVSLINDAWFHKKVNGKFKKSGISSINKNTM